MSGQDRREDGQDRQDRAWRAVAVALNVLLVACAGALFTAPPGSTIVLIPSPPFVAAEGGPAGTSVITAIVTEPAGTPVSDGTIVQFFTDIGRIDPEARTRNGAARANFVSDSRSGTATIRAVSGGPAPAVSTPASPGASPGTGGGGAGGTGSATTTVTVGNARVTRIHVWADPPRITVSNSTHVFAQVLDANGNPVPNVPVFFEVLPDNGGASPLPGGAGTEFFDITGPVFTNNNGVAENVMRTRRETQGTARVRARAPGPGNFVFSDAFGIPIL